VIYMGFFGKKEKKKERGADEYEQGMELLGKDDPAAFSLFGRAADAGNARAQFMLAQMYEAGRGTGESRQYAAEWYSESFDNGCETAGLYLARMLLEGLDPETDAEETVNILGSLFESGNDDPFLEAPSVVFDIGRTIYEGRGTLKETGIGIEVLEKGERLGNPQCAAYLKEKGFRK